MANEPKPVKPVKPPKAARVPKLPKPARKPIKLPSLPLERPRAWASAVADAAGQVRERRNEGKREERAEILEAVRSMSWHGYQSMIADIFRREGYLILTPEAAEATVVDIDATRGEERMLVSCRLRGTGQIGPEPVHEVYETVRRAGAQGAFVITDAEFGPDATEFASRTGLVLIDVETLIDLVIELTLAEQKQTLGTKIGKRLGIS